MDTYQPSRFNVASNIRANFDEVLANSLKNCHAFGLHSVALPRKDGDSFHRVFVARDWHELWKNEHMLTDPPYEFSVGVHPHHCAVTLKGLAGDAFTVEYGISTPRPDGIQWREYDYVSPIQNNEGEDGRFLYVRPVGLRRIELKQLNGGIPAVYLHPRQLHTVYVPKGYPAAWLIVEGQEDPYYDPKCYSNADLERFSFDGMYRPMSRKTLESIVEFLEGNDEI